jgi:hypothetical protein
MLPYCAGRGKKLIIPVCKKEIKIKVQLLQMLGMFVHRPYIPDVQKLY